MSKSKPPNLHGILKRWVRILGVGDWKTTISYCKPDYLPPDADTACIEVDANYRTAKISVLHPKYRKSDSKSVEYSVIHEVLHMVIAPLCCKFPKDSIGEVIEEQIVIRLSQAFNRKG